MADDEPHKFCQRLVCHWPNILRPACLFATLISCMPSSLSFSFHCSQCLSSCPTTHSAPFAQSNPRLSLSM
jgi:hypothetical protein